MARPREGESTEQARRRWARERAARDGATRDEERAASPKEQLNELGKRARKPSKRAKHELYGELQPTIERAVELPFAILGRRLGPHWQLSKTEARELGGATTELLKVYAPDVTPEQFAIGYFGFVLIGILAPRVMQAQEDDGQGVLPLTGPEPSETGMPGRFAGQHRS